MDPRAEAARASTECFGSCRSFGLRRLSLETLQVFEELRLHGDAIREAQAAWAAFQRAAESPEAAAEAIYAAIFDCAPNLQARRWGASRRTGRVFSAV